MKKLGENAHNVLSKIEERSIMGLYTLKDKGSHAMGFDKEGGGFTITSKKQSNMDHLCLSESKTDKSYSYAQIYKDSKGMIPHSKIKNDNLSEILYTKGCYFTLKSNTKIYESKDDTYIKVNENNVQRLVRISEIDRNKSKELIEYSGGINKTKNTLVLFDLYAKYYAKGEQLLLALANNDKSIRHKILIENKKTYDMIVELSKIEKDTSTGVKLGVILNKIEKFLF